ncbi:Abortive infection bacteriophage resistance protein [Thiohalomonas denitrificans]|uniref:Abortive infection bacteriophage resistance protein n=1 Tax=Thiohalomonas denitrificans TaxID=415747 RepID=A0A1G5R504_9GAMM|nr:Abortive infection bacteriophage resistance protein [Thiohalomonas denitrificans]
MEITQDETGKLGHFRHDSFVDGSHFKDAVHLYVFDKKLRLLALDALERIELAIRVDIAHLLGEHDPYAHEEPNLFHGNFAKKTNGDGKTQHQLWLERYKDLVHRARRVPFVEHYLEKYGQLPIWVAIEIWDFGLMSKMYAGMQHKHKGQIAAKYGAKDGKAFAGWLRGLNFIRNVSAHHSRLWNINVLERAPLLQDDENWKQLNDARPFFYFCLMQKLMRVICPNSHWAQRFTELMGEFPDVGCSAVSLEDFGLIEGWQAWDLWSQK